MNCFDGFDEDLYGPLKEQDFFVDDCIWTCKGLLKLNLDKASRTMVQAILDSLQEDVDVELQPGAIEIIRAILLQETLQWTNQKTNQAKQTLLF